ncbi:hypothetical protein [Tropicimonas aquimaris]|uniref:Aldose 1-epimerase n=1 Tax=Tropicimonas aquimaris TaxID=914152 RepID=A0ABW3IP35_9RHOB
MTTQALAHGVARAETGIARVEVDTGTGGLNSLSFAFGGGEIVPLHRAPWVDEGREDELALMDPVERRLAGDFFCAPFGGNDVEPGPIHGWAANSPWRVVSAGDGALDLRLDRLVQGAQITKSLRLGRQVPVLCQEHRILGGEGRLPVAHHPMIRMQGGARFSCSAKRFAVTPDAPLEAGRNRLACPARGADLSAFPAAGGDTVDLHALPIAEGCEDFILLVEAAGSPLGWSAVVRDAEDDVVLILKDPATLPVTMLWHSNGGRDYAPWDGRHTGVLGIEDGCAPGAGGHSAAFHPNAVSAAGVADALDLAPGREHRIAHAILAFPRPRGWREVAEVTLEGGRLRVADQSGDVLQFESEPAFAAVGL